MLAGRGTKKLVLGHLSKNNNLPSVAERTVRRALEGRDTDLYVAPEYGRLEVEVAPCFA